MNNTSIGSAHNINRLDKSPNYHEIKSKYFANRRNFITIVHTKVCSCSAYSSSGSFFCFENANPSLIQYLIRGQSKNYSFSFLVSRTPQLKIINMLSRRNRYRQHCNKRECLQVSPHSGTKCASI